MGRDRRLVSLSEARAAVSCRVAGDEAVARLGGVTLTRHQLHAAQRLAGILEAHGGALLADDVGLGKTFTALAVAVRFPRRLVIHPAALRDMWRDASRRAEVDVTLLSYEMLSRRAPPAASWDVVVLDEAHHARTRRTVRHERIVQVASRARTLLVTATPIVNRIEELRALFALFLGGRAASASASDLQELIVRRTQATVPGVRLPQLEPARWIEVPEDAALVQRVLDLPPPVPASDGGMAAPLVQLGLLRQLASSTAALRAALRRRAAGVAAMLDVVGSGRAPTRAALAAWTCVEDSVQLALPELVTELSGQPAAAPALRDALLRHHDAVESLLRDLAAAPDIDAARETALISVCDAHPGEHVVAFTEFAESAHAYWRRLRTHPGAARLTSRGGEIAGGRVSRRDVLERFAPAGQRTAPRHRREAITLLVTTDLLAEGVDLRDATVVVHLDLPWSPARLEQRTGRARRLGSPATRVAVYLLRPPRATEALLGVERRLRVKASLMKHAIGGPHAMLPAQPRAATEGMSDVERMSAALDRILGWGSPGDHRPRATTVAGARAPVRGWLAVVTAGDVVRLAARIGDAMGDAPALLAHAITMVDGAAPARPRSRSVDEALREASRWAEASTAESCFGVRDRPGPTGRRLLDRIGRLHTALPPERRAALARALAAARSIATAPLTAGVERELARLLDDRGLDDESLVRALVALTTTPPARAIATIEVLIVFQPTSSPAPATRS